MPSNDDLILVISTVASESDADRLAACLLDQQLAACVQIDGPIVSHYRWNGELQRDREYRLLIKSTSAAWTKLRSCLAENHPYEEPQVVRVNLADASEGYQRWVHQQVNL